MHKRPASLISPLLSSPLLWPYPSYTAVPPLNAMEMEGGSNKGSSSSSSSSPCSSSSTSSSSSPSTSRWNPTKEQISLLEGLYKQGIRTPSADQIQQITGKLREYGSIEGKNVFYWFQNHKARQRQKQKQESFAYFSRILHHAPPPPILSPAAAPPLPTFPPPPTCTNNVACSPYYVAVPQVGCVGFYQSQFPNVLLPPTAAKMTDLQRKGVIQERNMGAHNQTPCRPKYHSKYAPGMGSNEGHGSERNCPISHETLQLFPLHPTGILEKRSGSAPTSASAETESREDGEEEVGGENQAVYNFLGGPKKQC